MTTVREKQLNAIRAMLGQAPGAELAATPEWKVLVYDRYGQDIISPLLSVSELRDLGVTLHVLLDKPREQISDIPAVYFCLPTEENISRICKDCKDGLYESYQLNFLTSVPRTLLEALATAAVECDSANLVTRVFDMYCNFISLESDMFALRAQNTEAISYQRLNDRGAADADIEACMDIIAEGLFSVLATWGVLPIIRCSRRNAAEEIAKRLDQKLRDNLKNAKNSLFQDKFSATGSFSRPVVILLDRNMDIPTVLHHTWTYQALVHDLLGLDLNRTTLPSTKADGKAMTYSLDKADKFWQLNRGRPFPEVAAAVEEELAAYKKKEAEIKNLKGDLDGGSEEAADFTENTAKLSAAITSIPELLRQKAIMDMHTTLLTTIMDKLKERGLDNYYELEEELLTKKTTSKSIPEAIASMPGTTEDRMRLFAIYYMCVDAVSDDERQKCVAELEKAGCDVSSLAYLQSVKSLRDLSQQTLSGATSALKSGGGLFSLATAAANAGTSLLKAGVKNFIPQTNDLPVTKVVDALMDMKENDLTRDYLYFDPKLIKNTGAIPVPKGRAPFEEAIVFMVGGGNYIEYQNLMDYSKRVGNKAITYGISELVSANAFMDQLTLLGSKSS